MGGPDTSAKHTCCPSPTHTAPLARLQLMLASGTGSASAGAQHQLCSVQCGSMAAVLVALHCKVEENMDGKITRL